MSKNKSKLGITRTFTKIAGLASVCCLAIGSFLPVQAGPTMDTYIANFQADATNPSMLNQIKTNEQRVTLSLNEDFSRSFALLKDPPQADKLSGLPDINAGFGQFFSNQNRVRPRTNLIEAPSRLYVKVSFTF